MTSGAGHAATNRLEEERAHVARDENAGVGERSNARILGAKGGDDTREAEVEASCEKGGGDGQADDLEEERILFELSGQLSRWGALLQDR